MGLRKQSIGANCVSGPAWYSLKQIFISWRETSMKETCSYNLFLLLFMFLVFEMWRHAADSKRRQTLHPVSESFRTEISTIVYWLFHCMIVKWFSRAVRPGIRNWKFLFHSISIIFLRRTSLEHCSFGDLLCDSKDVNNVTSHVYRTFVNYTERKTCDLRKEHQLIRD